MDVTTALQLSEWRRATAELYAAVRGVADPVDAHALWRQGRDRLFREHPQSPLSPDHPFRETGLPYWPYDPGLRMEVPVAAVASPTLLTLPTAGDERTALRQLGSVTLPTPGHDIVAVWWLEQYGGGLFIPIRDGTAGDESYGGGRYLLDTAKGADLGAHNGRLVIDLNFLCHPSCRYDDQWMCPLAPPGNVIAEALHAGERLRW